MEGPQTGSVRGAWQIPTGPVSSSKGRHSLVRPTSPSQQGPAIKSPSYPCVFVPVPPGVPDRTGDEVPRVIDGPCHAECCVTTPRVLVTLGRGTLVLSFRGPERCLTGSGTSDLGLWDFVQCHPLPPPTSFRGVRVSPEG